MANAIDMDVRKRLFDIIADAECLGADERATLHEAADTIERLQGLTTDLDLLAKKRLTVLKEAQKERDAAMAEVERLKAIITENPLMDAIEAERLIECRRKFDGMDR